MSAYHAKKVKAFDCECERCGHKWTAVGELPKRCAGPKCKRPNWNVKAGVLKRGRPKAEGK